MPLEHRGTRCACCHRESALCIGMALWRPPDGYTQLSRPGDYNGVPVSPTNESELAEEHRFQIFSLRDCRMNRVVGALRALLDHANLAT
ncbi:Uncharacterised protein [Halioglobus japonicus]|nr:Uncharacterised protein [Halioglobus japonicus]